MLSPSRISARCFQYGSWRWRNGETSEYARACGRRALYRFLRSRPENQTRYVDSLRKNSGIGNGRQKRHGRLERLRHEEGGLRIVDRRVLLIRTAVCRYEPFAPS